LHDVDRHFLCNHGGGLEAQKLVAELLVKLMMVLLTQVGMAQKKF
jgi:hypothetical protein